MHCKEAGVNTKIGIRPRAYNTIGKFLILAKTRQTEKHCEASFQHSIGKNFANEI